MSEAPEIPPGDNPPPPGLTAERALQIAHDIRGSLVEKLGIEFLEFGAARVRATSR